MRYLAITVFVLIVFGLAACGARNAGGLSAVAPPFDLGPLPDDSRSVSSGGSILGSELVEGLNASILGSSAVLDPGEKTMAWAMYTIGIPAGARLNRMDMYFDAAPHEVWLAVADYGMTGTWQWLGPETGDFGQAFGDDFLRYRSPAGNLYWVIVEVNGGTASLNNTVVDLTAGAIYQLPPAGTQTVFSGVGHTPSLVMMDNEALPLQKAPVIAYTRELGSPDNTKLHVAYYDGSAWIDNAVDPLNNYSRPRALWLPFDYRGVIVAYNLTANKLQELRFDAAWQFEGATDIASNPGLPFFNSSLDLVPATGELGVAHSYVQANAGKLYYSWTEGGVWQTSEALFDSSTEGIAGVCFRFAPSGNDPWMFYSHGTVDTSSVPKVDMTMEMGRLSSGTWNFTPVDFTDPAGHTSPLRMSLIFDGTDPVLAFASLRDWTTVLPGFAGSYSLLMDGMVGSYQGSTWTFTKVHTATLDIQLIGFPLPTDVDLILDEAIEMNWPQFGELQFNRVQGDVVFHLESMLPTGGSFTNSVQYKFDNAGSWDDSAYFTGDPGREFSWQPGTSDPVCAYISSDSVDYQDVLDGKWEAAGDILYWSPGS